MDKALEAYEATLENQREAFMILLGLKEDASLPELTEEQFVEGIFEWPEHIAASNGIHFPVDTNFLTFLYSLKESQELLRELFMLKIREKTGSPSPEYELKIFEKMYDDICFVRSFSIPRLLYIKVIQEAAKRG